MTDLLLPRTDGGVMVQLIIVTLVFAAILWLVRGEREVRVLVVGLWLVSYGALGIRALH